MVPRGCCGGWDGGCYGGLAGDVLVLGQTAAGVLDHRRTGGGSTAAPKVASINNTELPKRKEILVSFT